MEALDTFAVPKNIVKHQNISPYSLKTPGKNVVPVSYYSRLLASLGRAACALLHSSSRL